VPELWRLVFKLLSANGATGRPAGSATGAAQPV